MGMGMGAGKNTCKLPMSFPSCGILLFQARERSGVVQRPPSHQKVRLRGMHPVILHFEQERGWEWSTMIGSINMPLLESRHLGLMSMPSWNMSTVGFLENETTEAVEWTGSGVALDAEDILAVTNMPLSFVLPGQFLFL